MAQPAEQTLDFLSVALTPEFREDPYQFFELLREHEPVHQTPFGVYLVSRHADAAAIVRDPRLSTDQQNSDLFRAFAEANPPSERSEEHTSELQSHHDLVCRLLLEKKKQKNQLTTIQ